MRVFLAGATGVLGQRLVPQLRAAGHEVVATTTNPAKLDALRAAGTEPVVLDGLDAAAVGEAVAHAAPDAIVHQMTALATAGTNLRRFDRTFAHTNRLRTTGTENLFAAARAAGVPRVVVQSFTGWTNERSGGRLKSETDALDAHPPASQRQTLAAIEALERTVLAAGPEAVALRYGLFYGPQTSEVLFDALRKRRMPLVGDSGAIWSMIHVDDAASATVAALGRGQGVYNIVDDDPAPVGAILVEAAQVAGAKRPRQVPVWLARLAGGEAAVSMMTQLRGSSNAKAKSELNWTPKWASWRDGFRYGLHDEDIERWYAHCG